MKWTLLLWLEQLAARTAAAAEMLRGH